jgi:uncharacterized caspase-like protein
VTSVAFSADGQRVLTGGHDLTARLWDAQTGKSLVTLKGHEGCVKSVAFSPDGQRVVTGAMDQTARLWNAETGKEVRSLPVAVKGGGATVLSVAFSPDGRRVVTGSNDNPNLARLWNAQSGQLVASFKGHSSWLKAATLSPDGERVLTGSQDDTARLWDSRTGKELLVLKGHAAEVNAVAFAPDGKRVLTGSHDHTARLWDAQTGKPSLVLKGHTGSVSSVAFSPDGGRVLTGSEDKTTRLWDSRAGKELCRMVSFPDGSWAVVDHLGRYDASNGGDVKGLHWVVNREPVALSQLKERYYEPGLLAKCLGLNKEPLREVGEFKDVKLYPDVSGDVVLADPKKPRLDVKLTDQGGGIGRVVVLVNGKELTADARLKGIDPKAGKLEVAVDLSDDPRVVPGQKNTVEVLAYNSEGYLASRGMVREFDGPGPAAADPTTLHAVVAGVSKYRGKSLDLKYAAKDGDDFATALELGARRFLDPDGKHPERVRITRLTSEDGDARPARARLLKALEGLKKTKPGDLVVVYLAGHGVAQGGQDGDWHYLTADAQSADLTDPAVRKQVSLSSAELTDLLKTAPAQKQILILDTCHAGRAIEKMTEKRDVPGSQVRALERLKDRTGMHVLAGCAADAVSYEASCFGQGLLTYSLLMGMKGAKLRAGEYVDVVELFGFAADKVPELARDIGGVQRPTIASPRGGSFDLGRLTAEDRARIQLPSPKPFVLRSSFQLEEPARDSLGLSNKIDQRLSEASAARGAKLVFMPQAEHPGGVVVTGRYKVEGDKVTVNGALYQGEKKLATFEVKGAASATDKLAGEVVAEVEKKIATVGEK